MAGGVGEAGDGIEGLEQVKQTPFDLLLLDVMMPIMDGMTALRHLRQSNGMSRPDTPVIMVTAYAMNFDRQRFLDAGADGYGAKDTRSAQGGAVEIAIHTAGEAALVGGEGGSEHGGRIDGRCGRGVV